MSPPKHSVHQANSASSASTNACCFTTQPTEGFVVLLLNQNGIGSHTVLIQSMGVLSKALIAAHLLLYQLGKLSPCFQT